MPVLVDAISLNFISIVCLHRHWVDYGLPRDGQPSSRSGYTHCNALVLNTGLQVNEALLIARFESWVDRAEPPKVQRYLASLKEAGALKSTNLFGFVLVFETFLS